MPAPAPISRTTVSWTGTGTSRASASVSWLTGDVIVVIAGTEALAGLGLPTTTGLTFAVQKQSSASSECELMAAAAVAGSDGSGVITVTNPNASHHWGFTVFVYRGSAGIGNSALATIANVAKTVSLTPTGADGAVVWAILDFNADAAFTAGTPTPTTTDENAQDAGHMTRGVFDLTDQISAGAVSYGSTGGGTTGPFTIVAVEIMAASGGGGGGTDLSVSSIGEPVVGGSTF